MDRVRFLSFELFASARLIQQHTDIVDCIERGDVERAEGAVRHHLRAVLDDLPDIMRAHPDAFTAVPEESIPTWSQQRRIP